MNPSVFSIVLFILSNVRFLAVPTTIHSSVLSLIHSSSHRILSRGVHLLRQNHLHIFACVFLDINAKHFLQVKFLKRRSWGGEEVGKEREMAGQKFCGI